MTEILRNFLRNSFEITGNKLGNISTKLEKLPGSEYSKKIINTSTCKLVKFVRFSTFCVLSEESFEHLAWTVAKSKITLKNAKKDRIFDFDLKNLMLLLWSLFARGISRVWIFKILSIYWNFAIMKTYDGYGWMLWNNRDISNLVLHGSRCHAVLAHNVVNLFDILLMPMIVIFIRLVKNCECMFFIFILKIIVNYKNYV